MKRLLRDGYDTASRPSQHDIGPHFRRDNGGAIPPNLLQIPNTRSSDEYFRRCRDAGLPIHPARFPNGVPEFFIRFLTDPGQLVVDPFAGSNVTGFEAEKLGRQWLGIELNADYVAGSRLRFERRRSVPRRSVPQQREVPREAIFQVQMQIAQHVGVVAGEKPAVAQHGLAWPIVRSISPRVARTVAKPVVEGGAVKVFGDAPEAAGVGEGQFRLAIRLDTCARPCWRRAFARAYPGRAAVSPYPWAAGGGSSLRSRRTSCRPSRVKA